MRKKVVVLGASGSIGTQTLDVIKQHANQYQLIGLSVNHRIEMIESELRSNSPLVVCVGDVSLAHTYQEKYPHHTFLVGDQGITHLAQLEEADIIVNAIVGYAGLNASVVALRNKKTVALANKESLVVAGYMISKLLDQYQGKLIPIDSEHSGVYQCLANQHGNFHRMILTASGGSLRHLSREQLKNVSVKEALAHPNWDMGAKITVDSATMMNKAFEVIEAHHLFNVDYDKIDVVIHPQSKVHAMVEFCDHSFIAQLGSPDMRVAISYALSDGQHRTLEGQSIDFNQMLQLDFKPFDHDRYPIFKAVIEAAKLKNSLIASINGANEEIIDAFLNHKISFYELETILLQEINGFEQFELNTLEDIERADQIGRDAIKQALGGRL
jgi:1-deoxy-D-xylulose-5-phosphate reductoisomerase